MQPPTSLSSRAARLGRAAAVRAALAAAPGDPTSYIVDGKTIKMKQRTVRVAGRSHTFYETRWGPVLSYPAATLTWTNETAYALGDVNARNFRLLRQWFEYDRAKSVGGMRRASARVRCSSRR